MRMLGDKRLTAWTIDAAHNSKLITRTILSSENEGIICWAKIYGCEVPFIRPKELAQNDTPTLPVLVHAVKHMENIGYRPDYIVILQPTSPFRTAGDIDEGLLRHFANDVDSVVGTNNGHFNGAFYSTKRDVLMKDNSIYGKSILTYEMPYLHSIDINTYEDLELAEKLCGNLPSM